MASSKSSQTTRNVLIACLTLWSIISLIIIVVWATSPDMKGASQCRQELQALNEKLEGAKVMWNKDRRALEALVRQGWDNQTVLQGQIDDYKERLRQINVSLDDCRQENVSTMTESDSMPSCYLPPVTLYEGKPGGCLCVCVFCFFFTLNVSECVCVYEHSLSVYSVVFIQIYFWYRHVLGRLLELHPAMAPLTPFLIVLRSSNPENQVQRGWENCHFQLNPFQFLFDR